MYTAPFSEAHWEVTIIVVVDILAASEFPSRIALKFHVRDSPPSPIKVRWKSGSGKFASILKTKPFVVYQPP